MVLEYSEYREMVESADGNFWDAIASRYSGFTYIVTFSRVGFDSQQTRALVYVGYMEDMLSGGANLIILDRKNENWQISHISSFR